MGDVVGDGRWETQPCRVSGRASRAHRCGLRHCSPSWRGHGRRILDRLGAALLTGAVRRWLDHLDVDRTAIEQLRRRPGDVMGGDGRCEMVGERTEEKRVRGGGLVDPEREAQRTTGVAASCTAPPPCAAKGAPSGAASGAAASVGASKPDSRLPDARSATCERTVDANAI